ncbi:hypothetical protein GCM10009802_17220 [Streptomyces synnematoformans]|uniref:Uncharacterized protein n=1 Tax=Streptomyces synnematoformans TaxID=415721 RepID=A0ABP5JDT0_9ACTN
MPAPRTVVLTRPRPGSATRGLRHGTRRPHQAHPERERKRRPDDPPCGKDDCPNVYRTASGSFVVQGAVSEAFEAPEGESLVEIPEETMREAVRALGW